MKNVLEYLNASAAAFPEKTAIADKEHSYTFNELQHISMRLAAVSALKECDNSPVGVFVERDADILVFFMAVLYSGNFYVPLDPEMPDAKLNMIVSNSGMKVILGLEKHTELIKKIESPVSFTVLSDAPEEEYDASAGKGDSDPLYMVYTSGSTGVPKGVLKSHRSVISYIDAYVDEFGFTSDDVIGNQTPFFFDASAKDIYLMLKTGAGMEILPTEYFMMPPTLIRYMNERKVTFISWVPSALSIIVQLNAFSAVVPETLKRVFFIGEVMPMKHLNKWIAALPDIEYVNLYGSSEVAGISCFFRVNRAFENDAALPMGKPLSNCKIYLLDGEEVVKEKGRIGELYVVSDSVALCYFGDPEKTEKAFVIKDFGSGPVRAFKSGDLAQYDENGDLVFASRSDFQIKHMGHRIVLVEIETIAGALDCIQRCCCLYDSVKSKIILFCTLSEVSELSSKEIKAMLTEKLSSYMVPNKVIILDEMPFNANNKIDRQKLKDLI